MTTEATQAQLEAVATAIRDVEDPNQPVSEFHKHAHAAIAAMGPVGEKKPKGRGKKK